MLGGGEERLGSLDEEFLPRDAPWQGPTELSGLQVGFRQDPPGLGRLEPSSCKLPVRKCYFMFYLFVLETG